MDKTGDEEASPREVLLSIMYYTTCSSLALISNKLALYHMPVPGYLFCLQIGVTVLFIRIGSNLQKIYADPITLDNVKVFIPYICSFVLSLYSNGKALSVSNVETVIVFRACSPILVCFLDYFFLGRELPSIRSLCALMGVVIGAFGYVQSDSEFAMNGISAYTWVMLNLAGIVFEMTYGKRLISNITFEAPVWGATLYTNALAFWPMLILALTTGESSKLANVEVNAVGITWVLLSCITGVGISWSGWNCRNKVSATRYTLLGVVCKFISVLINVTIWSKHASSSGMLMLSVCLVCSAAYKQAPLRSETSRKWCNMNSNMETEVNWEETEAMIEVSPLGRKMEDNEML